ncbi:hypothetical protein HYPSUDRAFT_664616 [Hypholoma sublateritium FD-334 SS-4]|uniref:Uncharacterized protein n=1 Tax=Hypholoma sublateritium (strain FD-334 SS-4) TaxID=945553 RepID=A0A0D2PQG2_HYPSF|nr:hypothetical protein HYPSUDRAFT_664616 [Hypholoma sublateritium FD-334 SS-4]
MLAGIWRRSHSRAIIWAVKVDILLLGLLNKHDRRIDTKINIIDAVREGGVCNNSPVAKIHVPFSVGTTSQLQQTVHPVRRCCGDVWHTQIDLHANRPVYPHLTLLEAGHVIFFTLGRLPKALFHDDKNPQSSGANAPAVPRGSGGHTVVDNDARVVRLAQCVVASTTGRSNPDLSPFHYIASPDSFIAPAPAAGNRRTALTCLSLVDKMPVRAADAGNGLGHIVET